MTSYNISMILKQSWELWNFCFFQTHWFFFFSVLVKKIPVSVIRILVMVEFFSGLGRQQQIPASVRSGVCLSSWTLRTGISPHPRFHHPWVKGGDLCCIYCCRAIHSLWKFLTTSVNIFERLQIVLKTFNLLSNN